VTDFQGCLWDEKLRLWIDPESGFPLGSVIKNAEGTYGIVVGKGKVLAGLTKEEAEWISTNPFREGQA
jgi:hypothetical protein